MAASESGVASVAKALTLLRELASHMAGGARFSDLCEVTGLTQGTAHRLLKTLVDHGFVEQDRVTRRYHLGLAFLTLGTVVASQMNLNEAAEPILRKLSRDTGDNVFLSIRSGLDSVCVSYIGGTNPMSASTMSVGTHRSLGYGAGAMVLLAFADDRERDDLIKRVSYRARKYAQLELAALTAEVEKVRAQGYAFLDGAVLRTMATVAVPVIGPTGIVLAAISVSSTSMRLRPPRRDWVLDQVRQAAQEIQQQFAPQRG